MNILVTGGTGYIGSHIVHELLNKGYSVTIFDNLITGDKLLIDARAHFIEADIRDYTALKDAFSQNNFSHVIHLAASLDVFESTEDPILYYENNVNGTLNILKAMEEFNVKNIIFSSTAAVYGEVKEDNFVSETDLTSPINPYGTTKLIGEMAIQDMAKFKDFNYLIFRFFNVMGAHPNGNFGLLNKNVHSLLPKILVSLDTREELSVFGDDFNTPDGSGIRDYIHVLDLATAHVEGIKKLDDGISGIFNLGNQRGYSVLEVIRKVEEVTGLSVPHKITGRRAGDPAMVVASNKKALTELGWTPKYYELGDMITTSWKWYLKNKGN